MKNKNIYMGLHIQKIKANFEAFCWNISLRANFLYLKSVDVFFTGSREKVVENKTLEWTHSSNNLVHTSLNLKKYFFKFQ